MFKRDRRRGRGAARPWRRTDSTRRVRRHVVSDIECLEPRLALHTSAVISEVMYQPPGASDTELSLAPGAADSDFEFIELLNPSATETLSLQGMRLAGDVEFMFADEQLSPGEFAVVTANPTAFVARYGAEIRVLGAWQGNLPDDDFQVSLWDDDGHSVVDLNWSDSSLWPFLASGRGSSLELVNPVTTLPSQMGKPSRWQASVQYLGSPGVNRTLPSGVLINEVLAGLDSVSAAIDQVELLNRSTRAIDISGWHLGNDSAQPLQYQFPAGTILDPGEFMVLDAGEFNPTPDAPGPGAFSLDAVHGDQLLLTVADGAGRVIRVEDSVGLGPSLGDSWGRDPAEPHVFRPLSASTWGAANADAAIGPAVITEIHFHPGTPSPAALKTDPTLTADDLEYIEIYNPTPEPLDLSVWSLAGVVQFAFPEGSQLGVDEALVVVGFDPDRPESAARLEAFRQHYGLDTTVRLAGPYEGHQPNDFGQVTLWQAGDSSAVDPDFTPEFLRDDARYDDVPPWPAETDGNGLALDRLDVDVSGVAADGWMAKLPTPGEVRFDPPAQAQLPDLVIWDDPLLGLNYFDYLDIHPRSGQQIMRFSTAVQNAGDGPLIVRGGDVVDGNQQVLQVVENDDGTTREFAAGQYVFHPTHGHVHFADYAFYRLYEVTAEGGVGAQVAGGEKVSFCLLDSAPFDTNLAGAPKLPVFASCERQTQGISVGWADVYTSDLDDQWINIEGLAAGEYWFETVVDPYNNLLEADETNNSIRHKVVLGVPEYEPDYLDAAETNQLRLGTGDKLLSQLSIHRPGDVDTFRWVAPADGTLDVDLAFDHAQGDIDLYVWGTNSQGQVELVRSEAEGNGEHVTTTVTGGKTYFVVVKELSGDTNPTYELTLDGPDIPADALEPNDHVLEPTFLGEANQTLKDLTIHSATDRDFFAWTAPATATLLLDLQFNSAQGNLDLFVHDFANNRVASSESNIGRELLEVNVEQGRTYLIIVQGRDGDMVSHYDLTVDLLNIPLDEYEPNDAREEPAHLGAGDRELENLSIHKPFNRDFYRWQAPADGTAVVDLLFAQADGNLDLVAWHGSESFAMSSSNTDNEQLTFPVQGGHTYLLEVLGKNGATNPRYRLNVSGPESVPDSYEPNDTPATASDLGEGDVASIQANLHAAFDADFYDWTPEANGVVIVDLLFQHLAGDVDLILWANGEEVERSETTDDNERLFVYVESDQSYTLEVRGKEGDVNPAYELRIDGPELSPDLFEPNDALASAVDLGRGDVQLAGMNIHEAGNSDFYRWSAAATGPAVVDLRFVHDEGDLDLALWIDDLETQRSDSLDDNEQLTLNVIRDREYIIEVRGKLDAINLDYGLSIHGPAAPQVVSLEVAKASQPEQWDEPLAVDPTTRSIPWRDWQQIRIGFSQDVIVRADDLRIVGTSVPTYALTDFRYDATSYTATWSLPVAPGADQLTLTLNDRISDRWLNTLDGDALTTALPSGDGEPGGVFRWRLEVLPGDFHADGQLNALDIDALAAAIQAMDSFGDLDGDGQATSADIQVLVGDLIGTTIGDINLNGRFDSSDLVIAFAAGQFEDDVVGNSRWETGDFNGDGEFNSSDLVFAFQAGGYRTD